MRVLLNGTAAQPITVIISDCHGTDLRLSVGIFRFLRESRNWICLALLSNIAVSNNKFFFSTSTWFVFYHPSLHAYENLKFRESLPLGPVKQPDQTLPTGYRSRSTWLVLTIPKVYRPSQFYFPPSPIYAAPLLSSPLPHCCCLGCWRSSWMKVAVCAGSAECMCAL